MLPGIITFCGVLGVTSSDQHRSFGKAELPASAGSSNSNRFPYFQGWTIKWFSAHAGLLGPMQNISIVAPRPVHLPPILSKFKPLADSCPARSTAHFLRLKPLVAHQPRWQARCFDCFLAVTHFWVLTDVKGSLSSSLLFFNICQGVLTSPLCKIRGSIPHF